MSKDKRTGWLLELKEGDEVAISLGSWARERFLIGTVEKITPTGRLTVSGIKYSSAGREMGSSDSYHTNWLKELTPERRARIHESRFREWAKNYDFHLLPLDKIKRIYKIVKLEKLEFRTEHDLLVAED